MPALPNQKHEQFVQGLTSGLSGSAAYVKAYGASKAPEVSASRLLRDVKVQARLQELRNEVNAAAKERLVEVAVTDLRDKEVRIQRLALMIDRMERVVDARSKAYAKFREKRKGPKGREVTVDVQIPGGDQGLVVPVYAAGGKVAFELDTSLVREYRATLQQIGQECGPPPMIEREGDDALDELAKAIRNSPETPPE